MIDDFNGDRAAKAQRKLSRSQYVTAQERLGMATFLQYCLPGSPSLYYGDEAGMEGYNDPFNRRTYPWGKEDPEFLAHFRRLGQLRNTCPALRSGSIRFFQATNQQVGFTRICDEQKLRIYVNRGVDDWELPTGKVLLAHNLRTVSYDSLCLAPMGYCVVADE